MNCKTVRPIFLLFGIVLLGMGINGCKPIELRDAVIEKVVGLEEIELSSDTVTNDLNTQTIEWEAISGAALYRYQWDSVDENGWTETAVNSFVPEEEFAEGEHLLHLQVRNGDGLWSPIYTFIFTFDSTLPDAPTVSGPDSTEERRPTWTWEAVEGAAGYSLQLDSTSTDGWVEVSDLSYTPAADLTIGPHTLYVRAKNSGGEWSGWGYKTLLVTAPDDPGDPADTTPPTVDSASPADGTSSANGGLAVTITFSEAMDASSAEGAFSLTGASGPVTGTFSWSTDSKVLTFDPANDLATGQYTYTVGNTAKDSSGNSMTAAYSGTFEVTAAGDTTPPTVLSGSPANGAAAIAADTNIVITFSEGMDTTSTQAAFELLENGTTISEGTFSWSDGNTMMTFNPAADLADSASCQYSLGATASDAALNQLGTAYGPVPFTVAAPVADTTPPTVVSHTPGTGEVSPDVSVVITFSEAMDKGSVETAFSLAEGVTPISGTFSWSGGDTVMTFTPADPLTAGVTYNYSLDDTEVKDVAGNGLSGGLDSVTITVVDLFNGTPIAIATSYAKPMDLIWDSDNSRYIAICNNDNDFYFYSFSDDTLVPLDSEIISTSLQVKNAVVMRTNSQNSVVWSNQPTGDDTINLTNISDTWSVGSTTPVYTGSHFSSSLSACWNPTDSEIAIVWIDSNTVSFMRVDTSGTILSGPTTVGTGTNMKHSSQVFWTGGSNYTVVYAENTSDYKIYLHTISGSSSYEPSSQAGPLTPSEHNVYFRFAAVYTGSELGITWLDSISSHDLDLYFKRFDSDGTALSSKSLILQDFTGNDYVSGFFTEDGMDLQYNGSAYGLVWSQSDNTSSVVGLAETQFCKIEDISGTWKAPTAPIVISQGDGADGSTEYLTPHLAWNGNHWAAIWKEFWASDVYFRE